MIEIPKLVGTIYFPVAREKLRTAKKNFPSRKIFLAVRNLFSTFVQEYLNQNLNEKNISIDGSRIDGMRRVVGKKRFTKSQIDIKRQYKNRGFPEI
jgi:hypothetical protein